MSRLTLSLALAPALAVVAIAGHAPAWSAEHIVPVVNRFAEQFDKLGIRGLVKEAGLRQIFYEDDQGTDVTVYLALPVAEPPAELPAPAKYLVLPEVTRGPHNQVALGGGRADRLTRCGTFASDRGRCGGAR